MQSNTLQSSPSTINDPALSTRFMRLGGAPNALGFAQIMQAFETGRESSLAQTIADSQDDQVATDQNQSTDSDVVGEADADQDGTDSIDDAADQGRSVKGINSQDTKSGDVVGDSSAAGVGQGQMVNIEPSVPASQAIQENTQENEASLRLLKNQSEQAKLSIKGLVRSLTQGAGTDATALAVQTRLGQDQPAIPSASVDDQLQAHAKTHDSVPVQAQPISASDSVSKDVPSPALTNRTQQPGSEVMSPPGLVIDQSALPVDARSNGSDIGVSQSRTQRVDVGSLASQIQAANPSGDADRASATQRAAQLAGITQSKSSAAIKSISSIDAGNIGSQPRDPNPGSLVERMKSSAASSETNRAGVMAQVQRGLASLLRSGSSEMTLKLTPVHLGEVRISIKPGKTGLGIRFETTSNEATELLESSVKELSVALRTKGIALDQIRVEHSLIQATQDDLGAHAESSFSPESQSNQSPSQDQSGHHRSGSHGEMDDGVDVLSEQNPDQPESIWTEIGLDAIA